MQKETPRCCEECRHYISGAKCRAFDLIPIEFFNDAGQHNKRLSTQKGDFVFSSDIPAPIMYIYPLEKKHT